MELFRTQQYYIFVNGEHSLWWDRFSGELLPKTGWDLVAANDPECLGICHGIIGKVEHPSVFEQRLMIIKEISRIGRLYGNHEVYKIKSIAFLQLGTENENENLNLQKCQKHKSYDPNQKSTSSLFNNLQQNAALSKTWGTLKSAGNTIKNTTQQAATIATNQVKNTVRKRDVTKDREKFEKRILEEFYKIFTDTNSFYFSRTTDITNSLQRLNNLEKENKIDSKAIWKTVDDRFFWNKHMLKDLISKNDPLCDPWILPIIQGFIQVENCYVELGIDTYTNEPSESKVETFTLSLISRRSRFRAGTRYKRRGVDEEGHCANYVETEQIISYHNHQVSFVQVRGSVPVYWSQPGYKYRPPPRLDKGEAETKLAFEKHFDKELLKYGPICVVNLVDQTGKEKVIWDAYTDYLRSYDNPNLVYVTFDFHEYCRGMHFENVSVLINNIADIIRDVNYCWIDKQGQICSQSGVFRVNCIDCLDRTNVVQTAIGKAVMEIQFTKLGLISPEDAMPDCIRQQFQLLWANNGDIISKQYAGTNALKGDYTRTGERKFTGIMKDGMNSANRYYLSRFKDVYRQGTIDLMLGNAISEDIFSDKSTFEEDTVATAEHVKLLIEDSKKMLISDPDIVLGAWGLIDADPNTGDINETEMDSILILTRDAYFVAEYDDQVDKVTKYQRVELKDLALLECGFPESSMSLFKNVSKTKQSYCIRINYRVDGVDGYFHMFRSTNLRFFNNLAVAIKNEEEEIESLKAICEAFLVAIDLCTMPPVPFHVGQKLERRKSKTVNMNNSNNVYLDITGLPNLTRNVSESQLLAIKSAGTKALSNMTEQFSKLNRFGQNLNVKSSKFLTKPKFTIGKSSDKSNTSSESEDEIDISIYQPQIPITLQPHDENQDVICANDTQNRPDTFLPSVGIVMCNNAQTNNENQQIQIGNSQILENKENILNEGSKVDHVQLNSVMDNVFIQKERSVSPAPEIRINESSNKNPPNTLYLDKKFSHSSSEVDTNEKLPQTEQSLDASLTVDSKFSKRSSSEHDITLNLSSSQSESALKQIRSGINNITSPVASVTKDLVLSPFSKLAKGMQNLGANLDPKKLKAGMLGQKQVTEREIEELRKLQEKWEGCKTRLIAL